MRNNIRAILFLLFTTVVLFSAVAAVDIRETNRQEKIVKKVSKQFLKNQLVEYQNHQLCLYYMNREFVEAKKRAKPLLLALPPQPAQIAVKPLSTPIPNHILNKIKDFEAFYPKTYWDSAGVLTIGYGFTKDVLPGLRKGDIMTREEADKLLIKLVNELYLPCIRKCVKTKLDGNQLGSLVSLIHNIGLPAFEKSQLVKYLNEGDFDNAADEFDRWVKVNGCQDRNLMARRLIEKKIFLAMK